MNSMPKQASKNIYNDLVNMNGLESFSETFAVVVDDDDDCDGCSISSDVFCC